MDLMIRRFLGETIKELTTRRGNDTVTSENVLSWVKRVEAQRAQAVVMSTITETKEFDKIYVARHTAKTTQEDQQNPVCHQDRHAGSAAAHTLPDSGQPMGRSAWGVARWATSKKYAEAREPRVLNEIELETIQGNTEEDIKLVSINSVQFNKNLCVLPAKLKTSVGQNIIIALYKIDTRQRWKCKARTHF